MSQFLIESQSVADLGGSSIGPIPDRLTTLRIFQGETLRLGIVLTETDNFSIASINPTSGQITLNRSTCFAAGDCIYISGHEDQCEQNLMNGVHTLTAVSADGSVLTVDPATIGFSEIQSFVSVPTVPGCDGGDEVIPPTLSRLRKIDSIEYCGSIINRWPTENTRLLLAATTKQGSNLVEVSEKGQVFTGDLVSIPSAGIIDAYVLRTWSEHNRDYFEYKGNAASTSGCYALTSEVGTMANFSFETDACGNTEAIIKANQTLSLPLAGDRVDDNDCGGYYRIGYFNIYASYFNTDLEEQSELIARGCVELYPSSKKALTYCPE